MSKLVFCRYYGAFIAFNRYTYTVCPFGKATQTKKSGGGDTNLGNFKGFTGKKDKYSEMKFEGGLKCWNGPQRSMTVTLICGGEVAVKDVKEPSMCEYTMTMTTPARCSLDQIEIHDEL
eukprot:m.102770 g.102770  ORF g.102770 m.102770 type:complete len:119 (-) comp13784_c0_seq5:1006-1362(-)